MEKVKKCALLAKSVQKLNPVFIDHQKALLWRRPGPWNDLVSTSRTRTFCHAYLFVVIDEYWRFPFVFPCPNMHTTSVIKSLDLLISLAGMPWYIHSDRERVLPVWGTISPQKGLQQVKSLHTTKLGTQKLKDLMALWKAIRLAVRSHNTHEKYLELVLPEVLHSVRSLLCTSTNATLHERFFAFPCRSSHGNSLSSCLMSPDPILLKRFVRNGKTDPYQVTQVKLLDSNPTYVKGGRVSTVSVCDLAPCLEMEFPTEHRNKIGVPRLEEGTKRNGSVAEIQQIKRSRRTVKSPNRYE